MSKYLTTKLYLVVLAWLVCSVVGLAQPITNDSVSIAVTPTNIMSNIQGDDGDCGGVVCCQIISLLGCTRITATGSDCNGNVCVATLSFCNSGSITIEESGDCGL